MNPPPIGVLAAFGCAERPVPLAGGQGEAVRCGDLVLKPGADEVETAWLSPILAQLPEDGFRLARPMSAHDGRWVVDGWQATTFVPGEHRTDRWAETLAASRAFHQAIAALCLERPAFLDQRDHPWAQADRLAWGKLGISTVRHPQVAVVLSPLLARRQPIDLPDQVIHGDLPQNVLFADEVPPAIIDVSPYWRPAAWADAIIVADALDWYGAGPDILDLVADAGAFDQLLLRAEIFRIATYDGFHQPDDDLTATLAHHEGTLNLLRDRLGT